MTRPSRRRPGARGAAWAIVAVTVSGCAGSATEAGETTAATSSPARTVVLPTGGAVATYDDASVLGHLASDGRFGILLGILEEQRPGRFLQELGRTAWPHTFFAPTDAAFEDLDPASAEQLLQDPDLLTRILRYHVVPGRPRSTSDLGPGSVATLSGPLEVAHEQEGTVVGGVPVVEADVAVAGGLLHLVEQLIVPCADPLVRDRGLPCREADETRPEALGTGPQRTWWRSSSGPIELTSEPWSWGGQPIVQTDLPTRTGIIHVLEGVVLPDDLAAAADRRR